MRIYEPALGVATARTREACVTSKIELGLTPSKTKVSKKWIVPSGCTHSDAITVGIVAPSHSNVISDYKKRKVSHPGLRKNGSRGI